MGHTRNSLNGHLTGRSLHANWSNGRAYLGASSASRLLEEKIPRLRVVLTRNS